LRCVRGGRYRRRDARDRARRGMRHRSRGRPRQHRRRHRRRQARHRRRDATGAVRRMIIVTGAAGFIGSNLVRALNARGERDIIAVDNLRAAAKFRNLVGCDIADYLDKEEFLARLGRLEGVRAIFHQGACSDTMESDGRYMMANNYRYSLELLEHALGQRIPFIYASSAAVYGGSSDFIETPEYESPLNVYGYSKL